MKVIRATQQMLETRTLVLGFQGENLRTQLRIDCASTFAEYPNATPALAIKPPSGETYPVFVERDGNEVVWDIVANNLVLKGDGELQLTFYKDNVIAKTSIGHITVNRSLQIDGEMPDVVATWIENANRKLAEVDAQIVELEGMVDTATDAATRAEQSASTASTKAEQAAGSAATATEKATEATNAAGTATAKAAEAEQSALTATDKANASAESERIATAKAGDATTAAGTATAKAEQATEAAQTATEKAGDASASARAAHASEINAAESADDALAAQTAAEAAKTAAETSATQAAQSVQDAGANAQTAMQKAAEASQSATDAETFAGTATTKAEEAAASAQAASDAKTAVEQTAEQLAESLEQIEQNTQDIAELDERKANIDGYYPDMTVGNAEQLNSSKFVENSEPYTLRTSGGTSDIGNREYLDAVVGGTVAWNQMVRDEASENSTDFAPIVTVTDAVEDAAGVKVKIEPVQDLHGYDHPWPAGGGKNLLDSRIETSGYIRGTDGAFVSGVDAWKCSTDYSPILPNTNYILYKYETATSSAAGYAIYDENKNYIDGNAYSSGATISITTPQNARYIRASWGRNASTPVALMRATETDTSFSPYANICPITGFDKVEVTRTGKNLFGGTAFLALAKNWVDAVVDTENTIITGAISKLATRAKIFAFPFKVNTSYTIFMQASVNNTGLYVVYTDGTEASISTPVYVTNATKTVSYLRFYISTSSAITFYANGIGVMEGALTQEDFESYTGQTYDITLPSEAGTVYGGELTVNADGSGSLVVDRAKKILNGTEPYGTSSYESNENYAHILLANTNYSKQNQGAIMCDKLLSNGSAPYFNNGVGVWQGGSSVWYICVKKEWLESDNSAGMMAWIANNNLTCVYKLATPITYTLTASEIRTLLGTNNIWADTGDLALTYTGTDEHLTLESGKKYLARISGTDSMLLGSGQEITAAKGADNVFDLTQMFGSAVADYVYGLGASFFRKWFGKQWYPYNAGELLSVEGLQSHDMVGLNQWDEEWENGAIVNGADVVSQSTIRGTHYMPSIGGANYFIKSPANVFLWFYDADKNYLSSAGGTNAIRTAPNNARFFRVSASSAYPSTYNHDICISLAHNNSRNGEYEPYEKHSYPLDSTVVLRGIPKVGANGVCLDGDRYLPDGTVEKRYGVVDLGTLNWTYVPNSAINFRSYENLEAKPAASAVSVPNAICSALQVIDYTSLSQGIDGVTVIFAQSAQAGRIWACNTSYTDAASFKAAMSGVMLVYELATPTTETAQPYHSTQWVSDWGTEEFVSTGIVPVGTETRYPANLRDKLQHLPDAASGNGSYLITQTDGQMVLTPFPAPPSSAGNYVLKATVTGGVATYTWEVAT